jgi:hypothetical protein
MERTKLLQNPLPIDRVAARVVRKAKTENIWRPVPKIPENELFSHEFLPTKKLPEAVPKELCRVIGMRRGRFTVIGYSAIQSSGKGASGRWVCRCDCGNYEARSHILRWLGTSGDDHCRECEKRRIALRQRVDESVINTRTRKAITLEDLRE